jgi:hypothetical protein
LEGLKGAVVKVLVYGTVGDLIPLDMEVTRSGEYIVLTSDKIRVMVLAEDVEREVRGKE